MDRTHERHLLPSPGVESELAHKVATLDHQRAPLGADLTAEEECRVPRSDNPSRTRRHRTNNNLEIPTEEVANSVHTNTSYSERLLSRASTGQLVTYGE